MLSSRNSFDRMQRRFITLFSFTLIATALLSYVYVNFRIGGSGQTHGPLAYLLATLPAIPFLGTMLLIPRYLMSEKDESVRALVLRALLWGFAVPMVIDTIWGFLWPLYPAIAMINIDIFCVTAMIALRVQGGRYQLPH